MKVIIIGAIYSLVFLATLIMSFNASFFYSLTWIILSIISLLLIMRVYEYIVTNSPAGYPIKKTKRKSEIISFLIYLACSAIFLHFVNSNIAIFGERAEQRIAEEQRIEKDKEAYYREQMREIKAKRISEEVVTSQLKDPKSALFRNQRGNCGEVNSKNSFGIMTGYQRFIVLGAGKVVIENESGISASEFNKIWASSCN